MPSLLQKKDGRWYINYTDGGQRKRLYVQDRDGKPTRDEFAARAFFDVWLAAYERQHRAPNVPGQQSPRIETVLNYYRDTHLRANNAAEATHIAVQTHCLAFLEFCRAQHIGRMQQLNPEVMARWSVELQKTRSARTAGNYLTTIRTAFNAALDAEIIDASPIRKWTIPRPDPVDKHPLTRDELNAAMALFRDCPIVLWMGYTGQRPSDARTLKFGDVDLAGCTVHRPSVKVRELRKFQISPAAALLVEQQAKRPHGPGDWVFLSSHGRQWSKDGILNSMKDRCRRENHPRIITPKHLRDAFGTIMANDVGLPLPELQVLMGHTSITTTMKYVRARGAGRWLADWAPGDTGPASGPAESGPDDK